MSKIEEYINRWKLCIQINGVSYTIKKTAVRVYNKVIWFHQLPDPVPYKHINNSGQLVEAYDVLIVSGCSPTSAPQCYRYRVQHQREQLEATGLSVKEAYYTNFSPYEITHAGVVLFYRCPYTEAIGMGIKLAKELNKRVVFDIDDLVIDTCYTDMISAIQRLSNKERALYDDGVVRMGATLKLCEYGITTTERLQRELLHYVPEVYINRNCASQMMLFCSERSVLNRKQAQKEKNKDEVIIGYFSGSLTHNADFDLIKEAIIRLLSDYSNVKILLMGEVKLPRDLKKFRRQIIVRPFVDWKKLPDVIASVDINLAPLENTVFNEAKSENKWVEAAIVKVPTVASNVGAFAQVIEDGRTGVLCNDDEWYEKLAELVTDPYKRHTLAENAYLHCKDAYSTVYNAGGLRNFYDTIKANRIAFVLPSDQISGGIMVVLYHACFLQDAGWNVEIMVPKCQSPVWEIFGHTLPCSSFRDDRVVNKAHFDVMVATMWTTVEYVMQYPNVSHRCYLVQGYETDFYKYNDTSRIDCEATYHIRAGLRYLTISQWCNSWLQERFHQNVALMQNGIRLDYFKAHKRDLQKKKIRILVEGDCAVDYKNVDESFAIVDMLDPERFETWYMSYNAEPKRYYRVDKFLQAVPYDEVGMVYSQCDILLKSSWLESFAYPPLEMMATGGYCVVVPNDGNREYLVDKVNCVFYECGDREAAVRAIMNLVEDCKLQDNLYKNGLETAKSRDWKLIQKKIVDTYNDSLCTETVSSVTY